MAATQPSVNLLDSLKSDIGIADVDGREQIFLTPYLTLACALLYMMAIDGELGAAESSQLQGVLGGDEDVLAYALRYVQSIPIDQFFEDAPEVLSTKDKWCILVNVCDALLSDGRADPAELALFARMTQAFGLTPKAFEPYFKVLTLKNDKAVLGPYAGVKEERQPMTPHFALAASLLYMLTADGSIGAAEIGQLEAVLGEFEGLQNVALKYVRTVKLKQFLDEASAALKLEQKLYILTNVCDSMLSDGSVARLEDKVFLSMLFAFGLDEKAFEIYLQVLETKNFKSFDTSKFKNSAAHSRVSSVVAGEGVTFDNELSADTLQSGLGALADAANQGVWVGPAGDSAMSDFISRTMNANIQSVKDDFGNQEMVEIVGHNATNDLNLQSVASDEDVKNRLRIGGDDAQLNLQKTQSSAGEENRQSLEDDAAASNRQLVAADPFASNRAVIDPEVRMQNIQEVVGAVNQQLDRFERNHFSFLQVGRAERFDDSFALIETNNSALNRQLIDAAYAKMGFELLAPSSVAQAETPQAETPQVEAPQARLITPTDAAQVSLSEVRPLNPFSKAQTARAGLPYFRTAEPHAGAAWVRQRLSQLNYVHLVTAVLALGFAAPINTQMTANRAVTGPLIGVPLVQADAAADRDLKVGAD